jgi:hypothetical protein
MLREDEILANWERSTERAARAGKHADHSENRISAKSVGQLSFCLSGLGRLGRSRRPLARLEPLLAA